eukprot:2625862-Prymnesium_polylepis.3
MAPSMPSSWRQPCNAPRAACVPVSDCLFEGWVLRSNLCTPTHRNELRHHFKHKQCRKVAVQCYTYPHECEWFTRMWRTHEHQIEDHEHDTEACRSTRLHPPQQPMPPAAKRWCAVPLCVGIAAHGCGRQERNGLRCVLVSPNAREPSREGCPASREVHTTLTPVGFDWSLDR